VALLCLVTLVAGFLALRKPAGDAPTAIRVDAAAATVPAPAGEPPPQTPALAAISLHELALAIRSSTTTSTTRPRSTTTTTRKPASTTTTAKPVSTTTTAPKPVPAATVAPAVAPTTTAPGPLTPLTTIVAAVIPPAAAVSGAVTRTDSGVASWFKAPAGTCAHRTLPMGTMIKVTRIHNGASASCKVDDRGPTLETGRLIDLSLDTFEKLAARDAGLIDVRIEW
jgi:rare lipoprotein A